MRNGGMTLIELALVITIIGILVVAFGISFQGWRGNYQIESQIKNIYSDLLWARTNAMAKNTQYLAVLNTTTYQLYQDTNSNCSYDAGVDTAVWTSAKKIPYGLQLTMISSGSLPLTLCFDVRGLIPSASTADIRFRINKDDPSLNPDYDCIQINQTMIKMGKFDGTNCIPS